MIENDEMSGGIEECVNAEDEITETTDDAADGTVAEDDGEDTAEQACPDYGEIAANDLISLKRSFPELRNVSDITELDNPMRYAALRDLGLTAEEAYLATNRRKVPYDTRAHLTRSVPGGASAVNEMSQNDYDMAREIFSDMSDAEIRKLYRKVTK